MRGSIFRTLQVVLAVLLAGELWAQPRVLDDFSSAARWKAEPSHGVELKISTDEGKTGKALRLDFDFGAGGGYAIARLPVQLDLTGNYEFSFLLRGRTPVQTMEFKLLDPKAENVWWSVRQRYRFPEEWSRVRIKKRHLRFAWGPQGGGEIAQTSALEIVVTAAEGGKGTIWVDDLTFVSLEPERHYDLTPAVRATSSRPAHPPAAVLDDAASTVWRSAAKGEQRLDIDFLRRRELGGLTIDWDGIDFATDYDVLYSLDEKSWDTVWRARDASGGRDYVVVPEGEARYVRLLLRRSAGNGFAIRGITAEPPQFAESRNAMYARIGAGARRGLFPKYLTGVQSFWTIIGAPEDTREALINEEGAIDIDPIRFSVEPFLRVDDGPLLTWADAKQLTQSLANGELPIPSVVRDHENTRLTVTAVARGQAGHSVLWVRYRVENLTARARTAHLYLAVRPLQVNPPWQFLAVPGGAAEVLSIAQEGDSVVVNGTTAIVPLTKPDSFGAARFDQGDVVARIDRKSLPTVAAVTDPFGAASGLLTWALDLPAGGSSDVVITIPFHRRPADLDAPLPAADAARRAEEELAAAATEWSNRLGRVAFHLPPSAAHISRAIRSNLAYILINMDGPSIQPGSRSYDRSWIRDGSLTSAALLRLAHPEEVRRFIEWYAQHQRPDGYVPCCVGVRGGDPVPEHDSHGQFLYLVKEYYDFTGDRALLQRLWPNVQKVVAYIDVLRESRMTDEYRKPGKESFFGLVPESISHEGYSAKPMHSYWDDFFVLKGLKDAVEIAGILGRTEEAERIAVSRDAFQRDLYASIDRAMATHAIDYIPGSVELGDFDATSTTTAVNPGGEAGRMPQKALLRTFDKYWENFVARRDGTKEWVDYTPYEWRVVGTYVRLGQPERALQALDWFFTHSRPAAWNHWAEVVHRDPATAKFIGDMPHTWVGSDFIRSVIDLFAYERESDDALVLGAAIPREWAESEGGVGVEMLRTPHGPLTYSMHPDGSTIVVRIGAGVRIPPGGIVVVSPIDRTETVIRSLPAEVRFAR
ncbi:MAG: discoidin domain-containing protein [Thermoanaerobaculia bacterium]